LKQIVVNAPAELRASLDGLTDKALIDRCAGYRTTESAAPAPASQFSAPNNPTVRDADKIDLIYRGVNAMAEALNGSFKAELIHLHGPWRTRHQTELAIIEWIDWYNSARLTARSATGHPPSTRPTGTFATTPSPSPSGPTKPHCTKRATTFSSWSEATELETSAPPSDVINRAINAALVR
jgi:hypothetical protein